jgi:hypothetical protein
MSHTRWASASVFAALLAVAALSQQPPAQDRVSRFRDMSRQAEAKGLASPYKGIHSSSGPQAGLYELKSTGVSTGPARKAAEKFLAALTPGQRAKTSFAIDDDEWRKWMNQHFYIRQGVSFLDMSEAQREAAFGLIRASLSAKGLQLTRDIMRLNHTLGEMNNGNFVEYGEWLYWITVMGKPSATEPWGWQLDGHHAIINYFVLGDQVVMTPLFVGSEPVIAYEGKYKGTAILQDEQRKGLELAQSLSSAQRAKAVLNVSKTGNNNLGEAFKDNIVLDYAGIPATELDKKQQDHLLDLVNEYVRNMDDGHAKVRMDEVRKHLGATWFAWIGGAEAGSVFYYRIHSPVILVEFDHQNPVGLRHRITKPGPFRDHVHAVVRTPNGNDYGKDLLRMHYQRHPHTD